MARKRRSLTRPIGKRRYRKLFVLATEGAKTEPQYFSMFNSQRATVHVKCLKGRTRSAPPQVLKRMKRYMAEEGLRDTDEAWLVADRDQWTDEQLNELYHWTKKAGRKNRHLAVSNPTFELWLLLHFENAKGSITARTCSDRLKRHVPDYHKSVDVRKFETGIADAIRRAKEKDTPPCTWPRGKGTTVYRLVERLCQ